MFQSDRDRGFEFPALHRDILARDLADPSSRDKYIPAKFT